MIATYTTNQILEELASNQIEPRLGKLIFIEALETTLDLLTWGTANEAEEDLS